MVGPHTKGKAIERAFAAYLERELDARCTWVPPMGKYASNDIFGVFDCVYINIGGSVCFAQVCHPNSVARHKRAIAGWLKRTEFNPWGVHIELWTYNKAKKFCLAEIF